MTTRFSRAHEQQSVLDDIPLNGLRCVVCWEVKTEAEFSVEHVPSRAVAVLSREHPIRMLTCQPCNNGYGTGPEAQLAEYLKRLGGFFQRSELTIKNVTTRAELTLGVSDVKIVNIPKDSANDPRKLELSAELMQSMGSEDLFSLHFSIAINPSISKALIRAAYLWLIAFTKYEYAYSTAGSSVRSLLRSDDLLYPSNYCLPLVPNASLKQNGPWHLKLIKPRRLSAYWVKIADHLVIMPLQDSSSAVFRRYWREGARIGFPVGRNLQLGIDRLSITIEGMTIGQMEAVLTQLPMKRNAIVSTRR